MKQRVLYLAKFYVLTVLIFMAAKIIFMIYNQGNHSFSFADIVQVIRHGLSLDLSTSLYLFLVPFLLVVLSLWIYISKWVFRGYYALLALLLSLAFVADTSLYEFWQFKLDASCLSYLEAPTDAMASVSMGYILIRLLCFLFCSVAIYWIYDKLASVFAPVKQKIIGTVVSLLLIPFIVIGIRGGFDESTTNIGQVYYSQNQFLNHSAVNPVFNFLYSLGHQMGDITDCQFMDDSECNDLLRGIYTTESVGSDSLLNTQRPDIVIILLESCGEQFAHVMPRLQQLKREGVYFNQCFANSWRTDRGTVCTLSGYPSFPSVSVMKMPEKSRNLSGIARCLQQEHYKTSYLYGGDINFTNMRSYLIATGWEQLVWKADYTNEEQNSAKWGVRDDITFATLYDQLTKFAPDSIREERYLIGFSTLSSHEPWDVPEKKYDDKVLNAFSYLDTCLGNFVDKLKSTPQWKNLLIVLVADHGINYKHINEQTPVERNHIPLLWIGGAVKEPRTINILCNQTDITATLLAQMGISHHEFRFSRDVLSESYIHPTAVHNYNNAQMLIDSTGYILYDFDANHFTVSKSQNPEDLLRINKAILQMTTEDLIQR